MTDTDSSNPLGWARPWAIAKPFAKPTPRAGAWYAVVAEADAAHVVLEILGKHVTVERRLVEIRARCPDRFTVVNRPKGEPHPGLGTNEDLGSHYAVCPSCGARLPLWGDPVAITCGTCEHRGEVAYWETG